MLKKISTSVVYNVSECVECEIGVTHPLPSEDELAKLYSSGNYRTSTGERFGITIESLIHLGRLKKRWRINKFIKPGKILDIGCGRGLFLDVMRRGGGKPSAPAYLKDKLASVYT